MSIISSRFPYSYTTKVTKNVSVNVRPSVFALRVMTFVYHVMYVEPTHV